MPTEQLIERLLTLPSLEAQKSFLSEHTAGLDDALAEALKAEADRFLRSDVQRSEDMVQLLYHTTELTRSPHHRALGLRAEGNICCLGGRGEYQRACDLYDEAAELYQAAGRPVDRAKSLIGKVWALSSMGRHLEAVQTGQWASAILETHQQWLELATLAMNMGVIHGRMDQGKLALALFDRAKALYERVGKEGRPGVIQADQNRAIVLRNLGHFEESVRTSENAWQASSDLGYTAQAARAKHSLGITYFVLGRHNEALECLDRAREVLLADGRLRDAMLVDLFISDCLLELRRFADVLDTCQRIRGQFAQQGTRFEAAHALLNEAIAYTSLGKHVQALASVGQVRGFFEDAGNAVWVARTDLERAALQLHQGQLETSLHTSQACAEVFREHGLPIPEARACLLAARASSLLSRGEQAKRLATAALSIAEVHDIPSLAYGAHHVLGVVAARQRITQQAISEYDLAIQELERMRGRLMVEFRADFLEDKGAVFEDMVDALVDEARPAEALDYAERAKSRALLDLLAHRLDLRIEARDPSDEALVQELLHLREERDRMRRRWEGGDAIRPAEWDVRGESLVRMEKQALALEKQITGLWHRLLIRNADYARDAALWQAHSEPVQSYLAPDTVLLAYFAAHDRLIAFLITRHSIRAQRLTSDLGQLQRLIQLLWLNLRSVPGSSQQRIAKLTTNAQGLLHRLHSLLMAPLADELRQYPKWIVVPHGNLHYLPFHALHDGASYVLQQHQISYLPGASLLRYCQESNVAAAGALVMGHSYHGRLRHAVQESRAVANLLGARAFVEGEATLARLRDGAPECRVVHLATHGEFRPDNPLFSGLALDDGWLTTLDIFNLRLKASLVVLSACQTGRSLIGGGDELLGLMRALLYAGAASVVLSLWTVEDRSTARLMQAFYERLTAGHSKALSLHGAQLQLMGIEGGIADPKVGTHRHPYFWAPFCLVGSNGPLLNTLV